MGKLGKGIVGQLHVGLRGREGWRQASRVRLGSCMAENLGWTEQLQGGVRWERAWLGSCMAGLSGLGRIGQLHGRAGEVRGRVEQGLAVT